MKLVVYIDVYFLVNGIFDFCVLLLVGRIQKGRQKLLRLLAGSAAGGLGATIILLLSVLPLSLCSVLQYGVLPGLMLIISFGFSDKKSFFHQLLSFYGMSFLLGGALLAFEGEEKELYAVLAAGVMFSLLFFGILPRMEQRKRELQNEYEAALNFEGRWVKGRALLDTGNRLREPISGKPVVLAEFSAVKEGLPEELIQVFENWNLERMEAGEGASVAKIRLIPYHAVGTACGLIPGIEAAEIKIWTKRESITKEGVMLGLVFEPLASQGEYQFILHEDIMS